jgi:L-alanine-DL-glutamate epimerase-like enolase superfamily enzyme
MTMRIDSVIVHHLKFPLRVPYKLSSGPMTYFDPIVIEIRGKSGEQGWGEALIVPGYTPETVEETWALCCDIGARMVGVSVDAAKALAISCVADAPGAASAMLCAVEMMAQDSLLVSAAERRVRLLAPLQADQPAEIVDEVAGLLEAGFRTVKVKVGFDWRADLGRVENIQAAVAGRATLRLDANRAFSQADGIEFASRLQPAGIELFEQPCGADDWPANAAVAAVSTVPVMLDESIYGVADIDRAASLTGVGCVKLKLKKIGGLRMLVDALARIRHLGMVPVLGDGVSMDIGCWMEACVATVSIDNAGEMNGFLKSRQQIFANPLQMAQGSIVMPAGYWPIVDPAVVTAHTLRAQRSARPVHPTR